MAVCIAGFFCLAATNFVSTTAKLKYIYIPAQSFDLCPGTVGAAGTGTYASYGVGGQITEISTFGLLGMQMSTADDVRTQLPFPDDVDKRYPAAFRVRYTSSGGASDGAINWLVHMAALGPTTALTDIANSGIRHHAGWDTINYGAVDSVDVAYGMQYTRWDTMCVDSLQAAYDKQTTWLLAVEIESDGDASADELHFLGLEIAYVPLFGYGPRPDSIQAPGKAIAGSGVQKWCWLYKQK